MWIPISGTQISDCFYLLCAKSNSLTITWELMCIPCSSAPGKDRQKLFLQIALNRVKGIFFWMVQERAVRTAHKIELAKVISAAYRQWLWLERLPPNCAKIPRKTTQPPACSLWRETLFHKRDKNKINEIKLIHHRFLVLSSESSQSACEIFPCLSDALSMRNGAARALCSQRE